MTYNEFPFNNDSLMGKVAGLRRLSESFRFAVGEHELKLDIYESVDTGRFDYELFEQSNVTVADGWRDGCMTSAWVRETNFPHDSADSAEKSLAAALRWISDYWPKKAA